MGNTTDLKAFVWLTMASSLHSARGPNSLSCLSLSCSFVYLVPPSACNRSVGPFGQALAGLLAPIRGHFSFAFPNGYRDVDAEDQTQPDALFLPWVVRCEWLNKDMVVKKHCHLAFDEIKKFRTKRKKWGFGNRWRRGEIENVLTGFFTYHKEDRDSDFADTVRSQRDHCERVGRDGLITCGIAFPFTKWRVFCFLF